MKKLKDITTKLSKEKITTIICISVASAMIILSTLLFISAKNHESNEKPQNNHKDTAEVETQRITYPSDSPKSLEFQSNGDGTCTVLSIGDFSEEELEIPEKSPSGDKVISISDSAFEGCDQLVSVFIPYTVESIGQRAFKGCSNLVLIRVDTGNRNFSSPGGILFTKNKTVLICYPADRIGKNYLLSTNVTHISDYAFYGVKNLSSINYEGAVTDFATITVGDGNKAFQELPVTCNYYPSK